LVQTRKTIVIIGLLFLCCTVLLTGCIEEKDSSSSPTFQDINQEPTLLYSLKDVIETQSRTVNNQTVSLIVQEGETITFDASESTDADGSIQQITWIVDYPGTIKEGVTVTHAYHPSFTTGNLYVTEIIVSITDDDGATVTESFLLGVLRTQVAYYLDTNTVTETSHGSSSISMKPSLGILHEIASKTLDFSSPVTLEPCSWNLSLLIERPRLCFLKQITVSLRNENDEVISESAWSQPLLSRWTEKTITFKGSLVSKQTIAKLSISMKGFSLKSLEIITGDSSSGVLFFEFTS